MIKARKLSNEANNRYFNCLRVKWKIMLVAWELPGLPGCQFELPFTLTVKTGSESTLAHIVPSLLPKTRNKGQNYLYFKVKYAVLLLAKDKLL